MMSQKDMKILELQAQIDHAQKRIEALEGCLREIKDQYLAPDQSSAIARAALAPASAALQRDKPAREENDDVFPGFRGNNDYA